MSIFFILEERMGTTKTITVAIDVVGKLDKLSNGLKQVQNQLGNFDLTAGLEKEFSSTLGFVSLSKNSCTSWSK